MKNWLCLGVLTFICTLLYAQEAPLTKKILLIGMDGCRADALGIANTPVLDQVIAEGYSCMDARTIVPTMSGPGWASMLTGVWYTKHHVNGNLFIGNKLNEFVHFFNHIEEHNPSLQTISISHWGPINEKIIDKVDHKSSPKSDYTVAKQAVQLLENKNPDAVFLHFDDIDHAGHFSGFNPKNKKYIAEIEKIDSLIGQVLTALRARKTFDKEDWLILISPDHGGINRSHGGGSQVERTTFILAHNKKINAQSPVALPSKGSLNKIVQFSKPSHQLIIPPLEKESNGAWTFEMSFKINRWEANTYLVNSKNLMLKTHSTNKYSWQVFVDNKKIKIQGDTINDSLWHKIQISYSTKGLISVYQDGKIIGIEKHKSPITSILKDSILIHNSEGKNKESLAWEMENCRLWASSLENNNRRAWIWKNLDDAPKKDLAVFNWQNSEKSKIASLKAPTVDYKKAFYFKDYSHYPTMVDITPTLLEHLGIDISKKQKATYFDGYPLLWE